MNRLLVSLLAAFDAVIAAAVGIATALAPLTVLWVFGFGASADWGSLWPAAGTVWQLGHLVPLEIALPDEYAVQVGLTADAAPIAFSLAPLAFSVFTAVFAARSGSRAARSGAWITGVLSGTVVFAGLAALIALTAGNSVATVEFWQAVLFPLLVFVVPLLLGAVVTAWQVGDDGVLDNLQTVLYHRGLAWLTVPGLIARGGAIAVTAIVGFGALGLLVTIVLSGGRILALFQSAHVDALGATVVTIVQLFYLPTLIGWAISFIVGPGFLLGTGSTIAPAGTQTGVVPGIPILGAVPQETSEWLLLLILLPIAAGAFAGWAARSRFVAELPNKREPVLPRLVIAGGIAVAASGAMAIFAAVASGSMGPGRLGSVGPEPGPVGLAVGVEVFLGAAILLLSPRSMRAAREDGPIHAPFAQHAGPIEIIEAADADEPIEVNEWTDADESADERADAVPGSSASGFGIGPGIAGAARPPLLPPVD